MSQNKLREHLVDYYSGAFLPAERIARLNSLAGDFQEHAVASPAPSPGNRWAMILFGLAACGAVALVSIKFLLDSDRSVVGGPPARVSSPASRPPSPAVQTFSPPDGAFPPYPPGMNPASFQSYTPGATPAPTLVAARVHSDWCPRCPKVAPIFDRFAKTYADQPILFVTFDVTDETKRRQAHYLASALGIDWVANESFATGMIKLIDRERQEVLATVTNEEHVPLLEHALAVALHREP